MRKLSLLLPAICLVLTPFIATADSLLTENSGNSLIGPYSMTLTPGGTVSLFCLNDNEDIHAGESWYVQVILGSQLTTNSLTSANATLFEEEAFIVSHLGSSNDTDVQEALWHIFDGSSPDGYDAGAMALVALATNLSNTFYTMGQFDNYQFYIYDAAGGPITNQDHYPTGALSLPQNFIGITPLATIPTPTPEPSTLVMLGTGLMALAGAVSRKLARA